MNNHKLNPLNDLKLSQDCSKIKLEIDVPILLEMLRLLAENDQQEQVRDLLLQLKNAGYLCEEDLSRLAEYYAMESPLLW